MPSSVFDHISDAPHGGDHLVCVLRVDLFPEVVDHDIDDVRPGIEVIPPGVLCDQRAAHHASGMPHEVLEYSVFLRRELDQLAAATHLACTLVELEIANRQ